MIDEPPSDTGADHDTDADPFPGFATTPVGTPGTVAGVTALLTPSAESPAALWALTVNVYDVPFVSPVHSVVSPETGHEPPAGDGVTAYEVMAVPPLGVGADHDTDADLSPRTATTDTGAPGTTLGVTVAAAATPST